MTCWRMLDHQVQQRLRKHHSELCCGGKRCTFWNRDSVFINNGQMPDYFYYWCATSRRGNTISRTKKWPIQKPGINGAIVITYTSALIFQEVCFMYIRFEISTCIRFTGIRHPATLYLRSVLQCFVFTRKPVEEYKSSCNSGSRPFVWEHTLT